MLLSRAQAAELIGVHPKTLADWGQRGKGPKFSLTEGGRRRYDEDELRRWNSRHEVHPLLTVEA